MLEIKVYEVYNTEGIPNEEVIRSRAYEYFRWHPSLCVIFFRQIIGFANY